MVKVEEEGLGVDESVPHELANDLLSRGITISRYLFSICWEAEKLSKRRKRIRGVLGYM